MDMDAFTERAAIIEFCGGMSRFEAETAAAAEQGMKRHEVLDEIRNRHSARGRNHGSAVAGQSRADDLSRVQRRAKEENRSMPECVALAGRAGVDVLALRP